MFTFVSAIGAKTGISFTTTFSSSPALTTVAIPDDIDVYEENDKKLGTLVDVIETGSNDVYTIKCEDGTELLLPAIKQCILDVDIKNRKMIVHVMDGLRD